MRHSQIRGRASVLPLTFKEVRMAEEKKTEKKTTKKTTKKEKPEPNFILFP